MYFEVGKPYKTKRGSWAFYRYKTTEWGKDYSITFDHVATDDDRKNLGDDIIFVRRDHNPSTGAVLPEYGEVGCDIFVG